MMRMPVGHQSGFEDYVPQPAVGLAVALASLIVVAGCGGGGGGNGGGGGTTTATPTPLSTPLSTPTPTATPTASSSPTPTPNASATPTPSPSATPTPSPSPSPTPTSTPSPTPTPVAIHVAVAPNAATISVGDSVTLSASVSGMDNTAVTWSVQEANGGTITTSGVYTAPGLAGTYHVIATSQADPSQTGQAVITVQSGGAGGIIQ